MRNENAEIRNIDSFDPNHFSPLALAFLGDAVFELLVRERLLREANRPPGKLHQASKERVNCRAQARCYELLLPLLTEEEADVLRRGKNAKPGHTPPRQTREDYAKATAVEALFGWLWLQGNFIRAKELYEICDGR